MAKLRRGFKAEAEALVKEIRAELGLAKLDRLDPHRLACHLAIPVITLNDLPDNLDGAQHFLSVGRKAFSALTVFDRHRRMIVHNDSHSPARQNSNLAHELAHGLLLHEPAPALKRLTGCRNWNDTNEAEAAWLGSVLLVTDDMALAVARGRFTRQQPLNDLASAKTCSNGVSPSQVPISEQHASVPCAKTEGVDESQLAFLLKTPPISPMTPSQLDLSPRNP